jgi:hypothetical protein
MAMLKQSEVDWFRARGIPLPVGSFAPPTRTYEQYQAEIKQKQKMFAPEYETEVKASGLVRNFLDRQGWGYKEQVNTGTGNRIDFVVDTYDRILDKQIKFGIECKRQMSVHYGNGLAATALADYLEQAAAYSRSLNVPVFIGPVQTTVSPSTAYVGGSNVNSVCALNIFGGRFNVGTLMFSNSRYYPEFFILRGATFWEAANGFNPKRLNMVTSTGSKKQRTDL